MSTAWDEYFFTDVHRLPCRLMAMDTIRRERLVDRCQMGRNWEEGFCTFIIKSQRLTKRTTFLFVFLFCIFPSLFIFSFSLALDFLSPLPLLCRIPCACKETIASLYVIYLPLAVSNDLYFWHHLLLHPLLCFSLFPLAWSFILYPIKNCSYFLNVYNLIQ